jgi:mannose-6-phosphate isomerase-like protein (cupin superfamily)
VKQTLVGGAILTLTFQGITHETEEVIVVLEGAGECTTEQGTENYTAGDVIILPPRKAFAEKLR